MKTELLKQNIEPRIFTIRGIQVMLDRDLASLYGVQTKVLNQSVKRNIDRFPKTFMFPLTASEVTELRSQFVTLETPFSNNNSIGHSKHGYSVYTELGVAMLSSILRSERAVQISIQIIEKFIYFKSLQRASDFFETRITVLETKIVHQQDQINEVLKLLENGNNSKSGIFFNDQIFDAYVFACDLIQRAQKSLILIDNYIDETTLLQLSKRRTNTTAKIYTEKITPQLKLDLEKHNSQYPAITISTIKKVHDRFIIIDDTELYHIGASLKDLGKKWFAFSRIDSLLPEIKKRL